MIILHLAILLVILLVWAWQANNVKGKLINAAINIVTFLIAVNSLKYVLSYFGW